MPARRGRHERRTIRVVGLARPGVATMVTRAGVTIVIPNWNHEVLLPRAISSALRSMDVLRKQGVAAEVLVIDDCSRDGSVTLLHQLEALYYKDGLRCLAFGTNAGLPSSRNQASSTPNTDTLPSSTRITS